MVSKTGGIHSHSEGNTLAEVYLAGNLSRTSQSHTHSSGAGLFMVMRKACLL